MEIFETCQAINDFLTANEEVSARNLLIQLLGELGEAKIPYPQVVNHLIRATGLFPYLQLEEARWDDKFVYSAFAVDVGRQSATLHREQSLVLQKLLAGTDIAVSAPTSFGKSFIIDAFIAAEQPKTVVMIVPTIALMDETRRRIFKKFSHSHSIITAPDTRLGEKNIFIFPQERAFGYLNEIKTIDLLVIDEFYKASVVHDKERSPSLIKAIVKLSRKAKQRYFLAPNIKKLGDNILTRDMEFLELLKYNTVFLRKHELYKEIAGDYEKKSSALIDIIGPRNAKTLVYAGTYPEIKKVTELVVARMAKLERPHTTHFATWLRNNYRRDWSLADLVERGVGVHNGQMHRCLSQIQVRLFEHPEGFDSIVSTSSIIEGVNTSAQNVVIWRSKLGSAKLKDFTYKNIIGRGGRMFRYFIGDIFLLDAPPEDEDSQLEIPFPDQILGDLDESEHKDKLSDEQIRKILEYKESMVELIGAESFSALKQKNLLNDSDSDFLLRLAQDMRNNREDWRGLGYLNSDQPAQWDRMLFKVVGLKPGGWDTRWTNVVVVTKALANNWTKELPRLLIELQASGIEIEEFFKIERGITFKLSALLHDVNELYKIIVDKSVDISKFVVRVAHAFLPKAVYHLEEYGLPRMISKKIHKAGLVDFEAEDFDLRSALEKFQQIGLDRVLKVESLTAFDRYIVKFFYDGITVEAAA